MSEQTETAVGELERLQAWQGGVIAGLAGGLGMGLLFTLQLTDVIENAIPALWALDGGAAGWFVHMVNSAIFGVFFAAVVTRWPESVRTIGRSLIVGGGFGVLLWLLAAGVVMPVWLNLVGFASPPAIPNLDPMSLVGHLVYGVLVGLVYPLLVRGQQQY